MEKNKMIILIVAAIAIIALIAAAVLLSSSGNGDKDVSVTGVSLDKPSLTLEVGGTGTLVATVSPSDATNKNVSWSTSNASVATVSSGKVTAVSAGEATITVTTDDGKKAATCKVTVTGSSEVKAEGVVLSANTLNIEKGETATLSATVIPASASQVVNWSSSDVSVATVSNGVVTAVGAGSANISATTADGRVTSICAVTVISTDEVSTIDKAILKVYGNANGDMVIDSKDVSLIQSLIDLKASVNDNNKIADANNDGAIDAKDVEVVNKIIAREPTIVWHVNMHDIDGDGTPNEVLVDTQFPLTSVIITGSQNSILLFWMLGITEEVKGASYGATSVDSYFKNYYLDESKVEHLSPKVGELPFENGKVGTSNIIANEGVTAVVSDWNRTYVSNWETYENNGIDVVRIAAASTDMGVFSHSALLLGLLFDKADRAKELVEFYSSIYAEVDSKLAGISDSDKPGFIASSMTGYISVGESDYNKVGLAAGGRYGLAGLDTGTTTSIKVVDYPNVYNTKKYNFDYILHLRTGNFYADTVDADSLWNTYTSAFGDWEKGTDGQYIICGGMPVPMRIAYALAVMHPDLADVVWADGLHQQLVDKFFNGDRLDIARMNFIIHKEYSSATLMVLGNANNDDTIDSKDLYIVKEVIAGSKAFADYPLADANNDGAVNQSDVDLINKIIKRESGTVFVKCLDVNGDDTVVPVDYPLRNVVTYATNMQMPALFANGGQYIAGYFSSSYDVAEAGLGSAVDLKGSARTITDEAWANFTALDASLASSGGIGAVLVDHSGIAQFTEQRMADLKASGIPLIDYTSADATDELQTVLTLGFLFGGDCEEVAREYAKIGWDVKDLIQQKVGKLSNEDKTSYICGTMYIYVCGITSSFNTSAETAGGVPYASLNADFASKYTKNSTKMASTEALANYTDAEIFINNRSMDWGLTAGEIKDLIIDTWDHSNSGVSSREYFKDFEDKLVYVNNLLPGGAKLAYMAHAMYGDDFSREWADSVLQAYIDCGTVPLSGQTLETVLAFITFDDYKAIAN